MLQLKCRFNLWTHIRNTKSLSMQWPWWNESIFFLLYQGFLWPYYESSSCLKKCKSFPRWLHASWWYPYKRWRLNKAAWYGHSTLIRTIGMVLIWIHQPSDQDYWSRPDHPKIVKTPPAISRYDGGHASLLIGAGLSNLHQLTPFVKMLFRKNFDDADNATRNIKPLVSF